MRSLQIPLDAFRTEHPAIERKLLPRLEPDDLVAANLELDAALLSTEAAMRLHQPIRFHAGGEPRAGHGGEVRTEAFDDAQRVDRKFCQRLPRLRAAVQ